MLREIYHFLLHLRLHYQFLILSGGYLLGGFMAGQMDLYQFWMQFFNVHILLFGGATAYNSWWDKDEGPIGGLKNPPKMKKWMHVVSLLMMYAGLIWALTVSWMYAGIYLVSFLLFWLYSTPHARWKGRPILSLWAIGISTGFNSVVLGTIAAGGSISFLVLLSATGATCILLSLYPVSQVFQIEEDAARHDNTFTRMYGVHTVKRFFIAAYSFGSILLCISISWVHIYAATILFVGIIISGIFVATLIFRMSGDKNEYDIVMKTKFLASLSFVCFFLAGNVIRYGWII